MGISGHLTDERFAGSGKVDLEHLIRVQTAFVHLETGKEYWYVKQEFKLIF